MGPAAGNGGDLPRAVGEYRGPGRLVLPMPSSAQLEKLLAADPRDPLVRYVLGQVHAKGGGGGPV